MAGLCQRIGHARRAANRQDRHEAGGMTSVAGGGPAYGR
ncbi:hypothetical protein AZ78_4692 [Lysobacter capsici AZ78]|uniref:Uncharacterized protein n=1 Tax=Lysobacter capsici AZ78 TaxID=1444315 RepID=A0A120AI34_9GAMM|nr:hypothetical protein AZ78_4692 [Lysobacter capsici AZ78]